MADVRDAPQVDTPLVQPITEERTWTPASQPYACQDSQKMATRMTSSRFVGRTAELTELRALLRDAAERRPSLALVGGESGVGKSRLADELKRHARESDARVLSGDCVELGDDELPYAPLLSALRPLVREGDPALDALAPPLRAALDDILPGLGLAGTPRHAVACLRGAPVAVRVAERERSGAARRGGPALGRQLHTLVHRLSRANDLHRADARAGHLPLRRAAPPPPAAAAARGAR